MTNVIGMLPPTVAGWPVEYHPNGHDICVVVRHGPTINDFILFYADDNRHALELLRQVERDAAAGIVP